MKQLNVSPDAATGLTTAMKEFKSMLISQKENLIGGFISTIFLTIIHYQLPIGDADNLCKEVLGDKYELYEANGLASCVIIK
jgi:hypothetical protein